MNKTVLLAAVSISLFAVGVSWAAGLPRGFLSGKSSPYQIPKHAKVLYNQNSNYDGGAVNSENYTDGAYTSYDDQGADDFVIPKGRTWTITEVDVSGMFYSGSGPATSENVIFYNDASGMPGSPVKNGTFTNLDGRGGPNFLIRLPGKGLRLKAGSYWVSVVPNMDILCCGEWFWDVSSVQHGDQAMWQNPPDGFMECPTWGTIESCLDSPGPDLLFELRGTAKAK